MKNFFIAVLVIAVLGLGGWIAYDKVIKSDDTTGSGSDSNQTSTETTGKVLDMSGMGLTEVGPDIYNKTDTVTLILSNNQLKSLKSEMGRMTKLQILRLDNNQLEGSLVAEIRMMPLVNLDASNNRLTGVPAEIGQLTDIETINFNNNRITDFPNEIGNLSDTLKTLDVSGNPLTQTTKDKLTASLPNTDIKF
jgi:Leucine-rich repeat (LRR) protein